MPSTPMARDYPWRGALFDRKRPIWMIGPVFTLGEEIDIDGVEL